MASEEVLKMLEGLLLRLGNLERNVASHEKEINVLNHALRATNEEVATLVLQRPVCAESAGEPSPALTPYQIIQAIRTGDLSRGELLEINWYLSERLRPVALRPATSTEPRSS